MYTCRDERATIRNVWTTVIQELSKKKEKRNHAMVYLSKLDDVVSSRHKLTNVLHVRQLRREQELEVYLKVLLTFIASCRPYTDLKTRHSGQVYVVTIAEVDIQSFQNTRNMLEAIAVFSPQVATFSCQGFL